MTESPELREILERDVRDFASTKVYVDTNAPVQCRADRRHLLQELALRDARIAELEKDAGRYRYLRQPNHCIVYALDPSAWGQDSPGHVAWKTPEQLDAAIDSALSAKETQRGE